MAKKYYWLKLKDNFFSLKEIKKLRRIAGGDTYTIIYLKLQLLSIKQEGVLTFDGTENDLAEQLSYEIDEDIDNIKVTLSFLKANNLIEEISEDNFLLTNVPSCIGKECDSAERVRKFREKKVLKENQNKLLEEKTLHCNNDVTDCNAHETKSNTEKEKEKEKELEIEYIDLSFIDSTIDKVNLTQKQYNSLVEDYGEKEIYKKILNLDYYITEKGKKYKDHNKVIRNWINKDGIVKGEYKKKELPQDYIPIIEDM